MDLGEHFLESLDSFEVARLGGRRLERHDLDRVLVERLTDRLKFPAWGLYPGGKGPMCLGKGFAQPELLFSVPPRLKPGWHAIVVGAMQVAPAGR